MIVLSVEDIVLLVSSFLIVSFLYSSVGHGGASGYLALMALFGIAPETMKTNALVLNLFVAAISFFHYFRAGHFNKKLFLPFALASIPMAFIGGMIEVDATIYKYVLAGLLVFAIFKMLGVIGKEADETKKVVLWHGVVVGSVIGFFSGMIGIGGGIILTPVILLMNWGKMKEAAAVSALFIWVNSGAGLLGQLVNGADFNPFTFLFVGVAVIGGFIGGYFGSKKWNNKVLKYALALVLIIACVKLIMV